MDASDHIGTAVERAEALVVEVKKATQ